MTAFRFTHIASIIFGIFALYTAFRAIPNALWYPRNIGNDGIRFGSILISLAFGLALIQPDRFLPALRKIAERTTPAPIRFLCALAMAVCLLVARLSGAVTLWISIPLMIGFAAAFIYPGFAYQNLSIIPSEKISLQELSATMGENLRNGPKFHRYIALILFGVFIVGLLGVFIDLGVIPSPFWVPIFSWIAFIGAGLTTALFFYPSFRLLPRSAWARSLPGLALMAVTFLGVSTYGNRTILFKMLPTGAAYFWGEEAAQNVTVIKSVPNKRRKGCHGLLVIQTAAGKQEICNLSREFLGKLSPGDTLVITGKATRLGLTIRNLRLVE